ncbi:MAG: CCA tRNA nucleotidyltransferase [Bacilli bacterium]|nr:CCA tRNA nucleotidyltransferase [Bacilli bacterium]
MNRYIEKGRKIIQKLLDNGYQAFFVGGFVRDYILGIESSDIDITTNALPEEVQALFDKTKATGLRYGTVTVFDGAEQFEVTTFRLDGKYIDHRKPESVQYADNLTDDLMRRDFTINAMAMDFDGEIIDLFSGKEDLNNRLIRAIGDPNQRFHEDALRIVRAFRFVSKLGFDIEEETFSAMQNDMYLLGKIANERVLKEIKKSFEEPYYNKAIQYMHECYMKLAFPELEKGLSLLSNLPFFELNYLEFFALCFYLEGIDAPEYWRFSNKERAIIEKIIELVTVTESDQYNEMMIYRLGKEIPLMANQISKILSVENDQSDLIRQLYDELPIHKTCDLVFKGQDILELTTLRNAEIIGEVIDDITYQIITNQLANEYEEIKKFTLELLEKKYGIR